MKSKNLEDTDQLKDIKNNTDTKIEGDWFEDDGIKWLSQEMGKDLYQSYIQ